MNKTPKLRFPEFSKKWDKVKLGQVAEIIGGGTPSTTENKYWNGDIPWFTPTEIKGQKFVDMSERTITSEGLKNSSAKILPKGTVLLTTRASLGDMAISKNEVTTNQGFQSIVAGSKINNEFIYYLQGRVKKYCQKNASGSTFLEISKKNIEKFEFYMPNCEEQQKIATFFSLVDKKIEKQEYKVKSLKEYKKGIVQKIFSQEIKFKKDNGEDYPEWKKKKLGDIATIYTGKRKESLESGEYIVMDMGSVNSDGKILKHKRTDESNDLLLKGDLIMPKDDIGGGFIIGKTAYISENNKYVLGDHVYRIRFNNNYSLFMHYQINSPFINNELKTKVTGSAQLGINTKSVSEQELIIPDIEEQVKTSNFLLSIDTKIEKEQEKLDFLKQWKKGLLQQMFV